MVVAERLASRVSMTVAEAHPKCAQEEMGSFLFPEAKGANTWTKKSSMPLVSCQLTYVRMATTHSQNCTGLLARGCMAQSGSSSLNCCLFMQFARSTFKLAYQSVGVDGLE